ncbi:hypothetical protein Ddc_05149 [Ditylenchus destructor]|nr:hypothetical protein Ddc_05149 [Ditylenchus destructor]
MHTFISSILNSLLFSSRSSHHKSSATSSVLRKSYSLDKSNASPSAGGKPASATSVYLAVPTGGAPAATSVDFGIDGAGVGLTPGNHFTTQHFNSDFA